MDDQMKVALIYRRNELFDKYMDTVRRTLGEKAGPNFVLEKAFPRETPKEDIGSWLKENEVTLPSYNGILMDDTCRYECSDLNLRTGRKIELDALFSLVFFGMVRDDQYFSRTREYQGELDIFELAADGIPYAAFSSDDDSWKNNPEITDREKAEEKYRMLTQNYQEEMCQHISNILRKVRIKPRSVLIVTEKLRDHSPLSRASDNEEASRVLQECFHKAGVPAVSSVEYPDQLYRISPYNPSEATLHWIVYDRHLRLAGTQRNVETLQKKNVTFLMIPLPNLIEDLAVKDLLDFSEEEVRKNLENRIREVI